MNYHSLVYTFLTICAGVLACCTLACLIRAIRGPSTADRLVAVNMTGTEVIALICIVATRSGEYGFADIAIIYALFSFLAVSVLTTILTGRGKGK